MSIEVKKLSDRKNVSIKDNHIFAYYKDLKGVRTGDKVRYEGKLIGHVEIFWINRDDEDKRYEVLLIFNSPDLKIKKNSKFYIATAGIDNEKYIEIVSPKEKAEYLKKGAYVAGSNALDPIIFPMKTGKITIKNVDELLKCIEASVAKGLFNIENTIVLSIPDEGGYLFLEPWGQYIEKSGTRNKIKLEDVSKRIKDLYKERTYDGIVLKISKDVKYNYLYEVIAKIEKTIKENNFLSSKETQALRYYFIKP